MKNLTDTFSFAIPTPHPQAGEKIEKTFEFRQCDDAAEAMEVMSEKKWELVDIINDKLKAQARSNAYQTALLPYKPSEVPQDEITERMVRDYIRSGFSEEQAREEVATTLAKLRK